MDTFSKVISYLFHPVLMPSFGLWLVYMTNEDIASYNHSAERDYMRMYIMLVLMVSAVVILVSLILKFTGSIRSLDTNDKEERLKLYAIAILCYGMVYYASRIWASVLHPSVFDALFGALLAMGLCLIITFFYKISAHMIGISGVLGILYALGHITFSGSSILVISAILLCGLIGSARMYLQSHTLDQIVSGFLLGFFSTYISICESWSIY